MARKEVSLIIKCGKVLTMNSNREILQKGSVAVEEDKIIDIGKNEEIIKKYTSKKEIDADGMVVLPGFINSHTHAIHNLLRGGLSQDRNLYDWLFNVLYAGLNQYSGIDAAIAAKLYCVESIRSGITTTIDNADWGMVDELAENTIETYQKYGIRATYARMFSDKDPKSEGSLFEALEKKEPTIIHAPNYIEETSKAISSIERLMKKYHASAEGRISVWPSPGIVHFVTIEGMLEALKLAEKYDVMVSTHLAESPADAMLDGVSATQYLSYIGYLHKRLLAGHCVWLDDRDIRLLKKYDVKVSHLPVSNQYLASGIAPITKMINYGITVSIGTDDCNCNESVNMISDMKHVALLQKVKNLDSGAITSEKVLEMATIDGARAVGMENKIGSIEIGKKADIIIINMQYPHLKPSHQVPSTLVYQANGSEIDTTIIDGKVLMQNKKLTLISKREEEKLLDDAQNASIRIAEKAGMYFRCNRGWQILSG